MKTSVKSLFAAICTILIVASSCSKDITDITDPNLKKHTCEMKLIGSIVNYDGTTTKAESNSTTWADGSIIYLRMNSPIGTTTGEAVYNASKNIWTISYYGSLHEGTTNSCLAFYVEDKVSFENTLFTLSHNSVIYEDTEGSYIYDGGDLVVTANLKPKTGRIRFSGTAGTILKIYGITHYNTYDIATNLYTSTTEPFKITVNSDGYTPYFYGYFTNDEEPNIKVWIDAKEAYTKFCSQDIFKAGQSGRLTIPTNNSHNGWADGLHFNFNGAQFKMIAVEGGTFTMGDPESSSTDYTAHKVTLTGYCVGETEATRTLYYKNIYSQETSNPNRPYTGSKGSLEVLIKKLNSIENVQFDFLTEAQWEFAAKGGVKSKGYTYSGSNNIDDVAWYSSNAEQTLHDVKLKMPNELGLYDMSGNAYEHVKDYYSAYPSASQVDPYVPAPSSGTRYIIARGGYFNNSASGCRNIYRYYDNESYQSSNICLRLALNWN